MSELRTQDLSRLLQSMLHDAWQYRQNKATIYQSTSQKIASVPWTATSGTHGIRVQLSRQVCYTNICDCLVVGNSRNLPFLIKNP